MSDFMKLPLSKRIPLFIAQVRQEIRKVVWPTSSETKITTIFVFVFALIASIYFMVVDQVIYRILSFLIN